jgi:hypothetical protein
MTEIGTGSETLYKSAAAAEGAVVVFEPREKGKQTIVESWELTTFPPG